MATIEEIFHDAVALPPDVRAELTERLIASLAEDISPDISSAQLAEVRLRIAQVQSDEGSLIPGDQPWRTCEICWLSIGYQSRTPVKSVAPLPFQELSFRS